VREVDVADGKVDSDDATDRDLAGSAEEATIDVSRLNLDSSGAYAVASHTAEASHTQFATADYTVRADERGEPVWIVTLLSRSSRPVGTIHIGAANGTVKRTEGMFAGATMEDVENDEDSGEEHGPFSGVKKQVKHAFHRTQEEARDMFERVKRSFSDFINRE
jgi:phage-related tail fiber protein